MHAGFRRGVPLWIYGHAHGHGVLDVDGTRAIRNALGYPGEVCVEGSDVAAVPFDPAFVVNWSPSAESCDAMRGTCPRFSQQSHDRMDSIS
jgi:hypothetical protein